VKVRYSTRTYQFIFKHLMGLMASIVALCTFYCLFTIYVDSEKKFYALRQDPIGGSVVSAIVKYDTPVYMDSKGVGKVSFITFQLDHYYLFGIPQHGRSMIGKTTDQRDIVGWVDDNSLFLWKTRKAIWPKEGTKNVCFSGEKVKFLVDGDIEREPGELRMLIDAIKRKGNEEWYSVFDVVHQGSTKDGKAELKFVECVLKKENNLQEYIYLSREEFVKRLTIAKKLVEKLKAKAVMPGWFSRYGVDKDRFLSFLIKKCEGQKAFLEDQKNWSGNPLVAIVPLKLF